ncbi:LOW QUALITY PROTEIN: trace amine-associated receptor 1-like [Scyliorhinus canicula]|uniref:LOW QUALITY PROTEIN: trace amine-associated receptor 1-like n=1 Tax=Scyliorhinus canicula TaxID=7830 RepID=UPI0018F2D08B|nr:LOW QUALITY PROTEIN: trace amine-associated receptor 1-like [Scyliorhinus canicula]
MNTSLRNTEMVEFCYEFVHGTSCANATRSHGVRAALYAFGAVAILVTIFGNMLVIISISHFKQLHTPTNYLILSLAIADFSLGCMVMPYSLMRSIENCWYLGELFCKLQASFDFMLCAASIFHLCFISVDRYYAVCDPLKYKTRITLQIVLIMIFLSWILSAFVGFGMICLELNLIEIRDFYYNNIYCYGGCILVMGKLCSVIYSLISFYFPGFIMLCIYTKIYHVATKQARAINDITRQIQTIKDCKTVTSQTSERKAAKTLGIVVGVFLICWSPYFTCNFIDPFIEHSTPPIMFDLFFWLGYLNSAFNPVIYAFFYSWFRKAPKIVLTFKIFSTDSSRINLF